MARARHPLRLVVLFCWIPLVALAQGAERTESRDAEMRRWSKIFFGVASTLDGGKSTVGLLRSRINLRDPSLEDSMAMVAGRYGEYAAAVERFKHSVSGLLDRPQDLPLLFRALMDGHQACWRLDAYTRLVETYGVSGRDLLSVLSSTEACARFRRAAYATGVEELIQDALADGEVRRRQLVDLRQEHLELERLIEDLQRIDAGE
jgi:hypothetical protein